MKNILKLFTAFIVLSFGVSVLLIGCEKGGQDSSETTINKNASENGTDDLNCNCIVNPAATITPEEEEMLVYMREEEKLARDVYAKFYEKYDLAVFNNISTSEQRHMDRVLCLLMHYGIDDPASTEVGVFNNAELQELYNMLIDQGSASQNDALTVGATIEDVDIYDLEEYVAQTSNEAILNIFGHLTCGSRNHMRSFSSLLNGNGITYTPQYINQDDYDAIIAGSHEKCGNSRVNKKGNANRTGNGTGNCNGTGNKGNNKKGNSKKGNGNRGNGNGNRGNGPN